MNYNSARHVARAAFDWAQKDAIIFEGHTWTYAEFDAAVSESAATLLAAGIEQGERVAVLGQNSDEYVILCMATARIGAVAVLLNYRLSYGELEYLVNDSDPVAIVFDEEYSEVARQLQGLIENLKLTATIYGESERPDSLRSLRQRHAGVVVPDAMMGADDLDRILYTSGTTSHPKGVMLTHGNAEWNLLTMILEGCNRADERTLVFAPLYHIGAQELPGMRVFAVGGTMVIMRKFDARGVLEAIDKHGITGMVMVSTMVHIMRDLPDRLAFDTSTLRWVVFGQVPENMLDELRNIFPNALLKNSYGLTEACSMASAITGDLQAKYPLSPGRAVATLEMEIVDDEDRLVPRGVVGEVVLRGPKIMAGYWRKPEATEEAFRHGWFHTGDMGYLDERGLLYVVDRKKDMIRTGGENVSSQEIERVIYETGKVAEVAVVPKPDEKWGEIIRAVIVVRAGETLTSAQVIEHCRAHMASFKVPKVVEFRDELPRNPSGKILKREL